MKFLENCKVGDKVLVKSNNALTKVCVITKVTPTRVYLGEQAYIKLNGELYGAGKEFSTPYLMEWSQIEEDTIIKQRLEIKKSTFLEKWIADNNKNPHLLSEAYNVLVKEGLIK